MGNIFSRLLKQIQELLLCYSFFGVFLRGFIAIDQTFNVVLLHVFSIFYRCFFGGILFKPLTSLERLFKAVLIFCRFFWPIQGGKQPSGVR